METLAVLWNLRQCVLTIECIIRLFTCALAVMSSLSWLLKPTDASIGSFSHGSDSPGPPANQPQHYRVRTVRTPSALKPQPQHIIFDIIKQTQLPERPR